MVTVITQYLFYTLKPVAVLSLVGRVCLPDMLRPALRPEQKVADICQNRLTSLSARRYGSTKTICGYQCYGRLASDPSKTWSHRYKGALCEFITYTVAGAAKTVSSLDPLSRVQSEVHLKHSATPINDEQRHISRVTRSPSSLRGLAVGSEPERGKREKRQHQGANKDISSDVHYSEGSDRSHETNKKDIKDDRDPQLAKRRKLLSAPTQEGLMHRSHSHTPPSATQRDIDDTQSQAN
ncbi:hypothetical protein B0O99DRAFT_160321 [Bisporella sp. PMI_857]|nr:hypothetical protein B0O99DRAFT_160321 [Bisporella sp. PMI_857]